MTVRPAITHVKRMSFRVMTMSLSVCVVDASLNRSTARRNCCDAPGGTCPAGWN